MDFKVDIEGLDSLSNNLDRAGENLRLALDAMRDVSEESLGYGALDTACADFRDVWQTGLKKVGECSDKLTKGLDAAKKNYEELETSLAEQFAKMQSEIEGGSAK